MEKENEKEERKLGLKAQVKNKGKLNSLNKIITKGRENETKGQRKKKRETNKHTNKLQENK